MKNNHMRWIRYTCLCLLLLVPAELNAKPPDFTELEKLVPEELNERNTPGVVIAIVSGDRLVYHQAFGGANIKTVASLPPQLLFRPGLLTQIVPGAALVSSAQQDNIHQNQAGVNRGQR